jgi:glycosyltransferase involved in cell wall biosynthesis
MSVLAPPVVSVIIPLYNSEEYINDTIQSVVSQTYKDWELIVVDDCSTDNSRDIVKNVAQIDERIKLLELDNNFGGPAVPRNIGIKKSKGKYVAFLDSDDLWHKEKLEVCLKYFDSNVDIVYHDLLRFGKVNFLSKRRMKGRKLKRPVIIDLLMNGNGISNSSVIARANIIKSVGCLNESKKMIAAEDYNLWLKISEVTDNFLHIPKELGRYLIGDDNISKKDMSNCSKEASVDFENFLTKSELLKYTARLMYEQGRYFYINKEYYSAQKYLYKSIRFGKVNIQIKSLYMLCIVYFRRLNV